MNVTRGYSFGKIGPFHGTRNSSTKLYTFKGIYISSLSSKVPRHVVSNSTGSPSSSVVEIPTKLNNIPHTREIRRFFYDDVVKSVDAALADGNRLLSVRCTVPELNPEFDVYRVGTLLELVREIVTSICVDGTKVKVCVQQSLGTGVFQGTPLALSGVRRILDMMDWGEATPFVTTGQLGAAVVEDAYDAYILISPQNITGHSVLPLIEEMVEKAQPNKKIIMINPRLGDIPSSAGVMGIRGRQERQDFIASFLVAYHFRLLYLGMGPYPIMGALRHEYNSSWDVYKRIEAVTEEGLRNERYILLKQFESEPNASMITECFQSKK